MLYYLWSLTWGLGWVPALAALGGASRSGARSGGSAGCWCPPPLLFLAFMGLQGRYFGRWLLPIFPILCLLAAFFALWLARAIVRWRQASRRRGGRPGRTVGAPSDAGRPRGSDRVAALLVAALLAQGLVYSVHSASCSRAPTRAT